MPKKLFRRLIDPAYYNWHRLLQLYAFCLLSPSALLFVLASTTNVITDLITLLALIGISTCVFLLLPIILTINRLRYERRRMDASYTSFIELMDNAVDMIFVREESGRIVTANQQASELLGYTAEELSEMTLQSLDPTGEMILPLESDKQSWQFESELMTRSGETIPVEIRSRKASWHDENLFVDMVRDISHWAATRSELKASTESLERIRNKLESRVQERTLTLEKETQERIQAEQTVSQIQRLLSSIIDSMPSFIIALDNQYTVTEWNRSVVEFTDIPAHKARGKRLAQLIPEFSEPISRMAERLRSELPLPLHTERVSGEYKGQLYTLDVMVYPLQFMRRQGLVIRADDVTERVQMEQALVQAEKMLSLGGLAAGMAHEINNPLGAILQSCQNLERRLYGTLPRNQKLQAEYAIDPESLKGYLDAQQIETFISAIQESGERAAEIVKDMLSFARPGSSEPEETDLVESVNRSLKLAERDFNHQQASDFKRIEIELEYPDQPLEVMARKNLLEQVFLNLLLNAAQALASTKTEEPRICIKVTASDKEAEVCVEDNGPGMTEEVMKRIFEPFYSTKVEGRGTGLGLSVSYFIVTEQLKGKMSVESSVGLGSRFCVKLPCRTHRKTEDQSQIDLPLNHL